MSLARVCELGREYLLRIAEELVTARSRGAVVVLAIFFYVTYLLAVVLWNEVRAAARARTGRTAGRAGRVPGPARRWAGSVRR